MTAPDDTPDKPEEEETRAASLRRRRARRAALSAQRRGEAGGPDPVGAIKFAGFAAALLVFVAVAAGFRDSPAAQRFAETAARLGPLAEPVFLGLSALEWIALALAGAIIARVASKMLRRR